MFGERVIHIARGLLGIRELTGNNDGPMIDRMLEYLGLPHNLAWCLAFCLWCCHMAVDPMPFPKIARCATFWERVQADDWKYRTFDAEDVAWGIEKVTPGTIMIFSSSKVAGKRNWNGHAELVEKPVTVRKWNNIGGNTMPSNKGDQREGGGVYRKTRTARQGSLLLEGFVQSRRAK